MFNWFEDADCSYNNHTADTPFGRIQITWKGWKEYDTACVDDFPGGVFFYKSSNPNELKKECEQEYMRRLGFELVAYTNGQFGGFATYQTIDHSSVLPENLALYMRVKNV